MGHRAGFAVLGSTGALVAAGLTIAAAPAGAAPAESSRVLPFLNQPASAVDNAGGSLVVGEVLDNRAIRAYFRKPTGTWVTSVPVVAQAQYGGSVSDIAVAGGPSGFYVITWVTRVTGTDGDTVSTVHAATRSVSGAISPPRTLFTTTFTGTPDDTLRLVTNYEGDAAVGLSDGYEVARYLRSTNTWTPYAVPGSDARRGVVLTMSRARTVDVTYANGSGIYQRTLTATAAGFPNNPDRALPTNNGSSDLRFDIAMDSAGLQTLIVDPTGQLQTTVYREATRRGTFQKAFEDDTLGGDPHGAPHVASRGAYTRVTYAYDGADGGGQQTRLYDGKAWGPARSYAAFGGTDRMQRPLAIARDGRGVEVSFGGVAVEDGTTAPDSHVQRSLLESSSATAQDATINGTGVPALDVGYTGVSQLVITERIVVNFAVVKRTVVFIRR